MAQPSRVELTQTLEEASVAHHGYERVFLRGSRDRQWSGFYAAYALGRLGDFVDASRLTTWLEESPDSASWPTSAAAYVLERMTS